MKRICLTLAVIFLVPGLVLSQQIPNTAPGIDDGADCWIDAEPTTCWGVFGPDWPCAQNPNNFCIVYSAEFPQTGEIGVGHTLDPTLLDDGDLLCLKSVQFFYQGDPYRVIQTVMETEFDGRGGLFASAIECGSAKWCNCDASLGSEPAGPCMTSDFVRPGYGLWISYWTDPSKNCPFLP